METKDFIQTQFDLLHAALIKITDGLTAEELVWQPGAANSIAFLMLHIARSEDINIQMRMQGKPQVWISGGWNARYGMPADETTFGWTGDKLAAAKYPDLKVMLAYAEAVHAETTKYVSALTLKEMERVINLSYLGDIPIGKLFARTVIHLSGHIGEMSYIRGLKRGLNK